MTWWQTGLLLLGGLAGLVLVTRAVRSFVHSFRENYAHNTGHCEFCFRSRAEVEVESEPPILTCKPCLDERWPDDLLRDHAFESGRLKRIE